MIAKKKREEGNTAFKAGNYEKAIECYTAAIQLTSEEAHLCYGNRSAAYLSSEHYGLAIADAEKCIDMKPDWSKVLLDVDEVVSLFLF